MRRHLLVLLTAILLLFAGAACSDDGDDQVQTATTQRSDSNGSGDTEPGDTEPKRNGGGGNEALCEALEPVKESNDAVGDIATFEERRDYLIDNIPELNDAYDEAIEVAEDGEMKANLERLRAYNDEFLELLEANDTEAELSSAIAATDTSDVEQAGLELNLFTTEECGFTVSG